MSNPFSRGALTSFPVSGNLTAMPSGFALGLGAVSGVVAGAPYADIVVAPIQIKTGAGALPNGYVSLYGICSEDNTIWDGTVSPSASGSSQAGAVATVALIQSLETPATGTIYAFNEFSVWSKFGFIPSYFTPVVQNNTGATLDVSGTNFSAKYALDSYT
jgi:hypothetical protein